MSIDRPPISTPNVLAGLAAVVIIVAGLKAASSLFVPFLLAGFITLLCAPALFWMRDRGLPTPLALIVVLMDGPGRPDVDAPVVISQRLLEALRREAVPELAAALGSDAPSVVELRLCDTDEMRAVLAREAAAREHLARPAGLADLAGIASPQYAEWILGKYVLGEDLVLVQPSAFALTAELLDEPDFVTRGLLGAVLTHELVHAADDARHDLSAVTRSLAQAEQLTTLAAAVEGHAQQVTRDVSQRLGWSRGFLAFTRVAIGDVGLVSDDLAASPWMQLERVMTADLRAAYGF